MHSTMSPATWALSWPWFSGSTSATVLALYGRCGSRPVLPTDGAEAPDEGLMVGNSPPGSPDLLPSSGFRPPEVDSGGSPASGLVFPVVPDVPLFPVPELPSEW